MKSGAKVDQRGEVVNPDTKDGLKYKAYCLLYDFIQRREQAVQAFKDEHAVKDLPKYEVPWVTQWIHKAEANSQDKFELTPQVSYFQAPLLEFAPIVIDAFVSPYPIKIRNHPVVVFLKMRPLLNQQLLLICPVSNKPETEKT